MTTEKENPSDAQYTVVARKYRPQAFESLIGQNHIATALSNAIKQNRIGHAYLFTGARGVGKTSSARIFAKCLNCSKGSSPTPCNECDICSAISVGEDVDVLEIDGASNRGIDEIRQLRSNAGVRPSRSKYKIYIIDEVHMLTQQAFNALLKTLEEPPEHVKFIFCTTDPQKIPITVLSRCQRFDFSPVQTDEIGKTLKKIAEEEGFSADEQALALLARRANGSMRDSQSLLEQLLSFCDGNISVDDVHQLLGTADISRVADLAVAIVNSDAAACLQMVEQAVVDGVDTGQFAEQLLGYFRDMMAVRVGCGEENMINCSAQDMDGLKSLGEQLGLEAILSSVQLLDGAIVKMQYSLHTRTLLEVAVVRICNLQHLESVADLVAALTDGQLPSVTLQSSAGVGAGVSTKSPAKKNEISKSVSPDTTTEKEPTLAGARPIEVQKSEAKPDRRPQPVAKPDPSVAESAARGPENLKPAVSPSTTKLNSGNLRELWGRCLVDMGDMTAELAGDFEKLELRSPDNLVVTLTESYNRDMCSRPDRKQKIESAFQTVSGCRIRIDFELSKQKTVAPASAPKPKLSRQQQMRKLHEIPFVKQTIEVFDAEIVNFRKK